MVLPTGSGRAGRCPSPSPLVFQHALLVVGLPFQTVAPLVAFNRWARAFPVKQQHSLQTGAVHAAVQSWIQFPTGVVARVAHMAWGEWGKASENREKGSFKGDGSLAMPQADCSHI